LFFLQEIPNSEFLYIFSEKITLGTLHFSRNHKRRIVFLRRIVFHQK